MAIVSGDIDFRLSGGASNSDPAASLGGVMSTTTDVTGSTLFDTVTSADATAGETNYRCIYVLNSHGTLTLQNAVIWIQANTPSATTAITIALDGNGANATAETVGNEDTAPSGESFVAAATEGAGLSLGNLAAGQRYAVWIKRVVDAGTTAVADSFTLRVKGDTAA
jgi:hypothetical protein